MTEEREPVAVAEPMVGVGEPQCPVSRTYQRQEMSCASRWRTNDGWLESGGRFSGRSSRLPAAMTAVAVIEVAAGALLIVVAVLSALGPRGPMAPRRGSRGEPERPGRQSLYDRAVGHDSVWIAWAAGAVYSVPGAHYLAGLRCWPSSASER